MCEEWQPVSVTNVDCCQVSRANTDCNGKLISRVSSCSATHTRTRTHKQTNKQKHCAHPPFLRVLLLSNGEICLVI